VFEADKGQAAPLQGQGLSIGIVQARFNEGVTDALAAACMAELLLHGVTAAQIHHVKVPGALEVPTAIALAVEGGADAARALAEATHTDPEAAARYFAESSGSQRHAGQLRAAADQHGVDEQLLKAIATAESGFNAQAVSPKGAIGLMQVIPDTALRFGVEGDKKRSLEQKLKDPAINVPLGARYLRHLQTLFPGRTDLVVAAYNAGEGAVQRYGNRIPPYQETQNYVKTVMTLYQSLQPRWGGDSVSTLCNMPAQQVCSVARSARLRSSLPARRGRTVR
jgi:soluble lytic murein transglycosylase-like protein